MRRAVWIAIAAGLLPRQASSEPADAALADPVVVRVGAGEVRARELGHYLGRLHAFERDSFGSTPDAVRRGYVERRLLPELLLAEQARALGLTAQPAIASLLDQALVDALKSQVQREIDARLTPEELREYCKRSSSKSESECARDVWSHRIALRRTKAHAELAARTQTLRARHVRGLDLSLLERLRVGPNGEISVLASAPSKQNQP
jgi:hypothetical protein